MKCPCHGCPNRTVTCHYEGFCDDWAKWKEYDQALKEWLRSFNPPANENVKKREMRKLRQRAMGWYGRKGGKRDD